MLAQRRLGGGDASGTRPGWRRAASHHALVVEATARGTGVLGSGSGVELVVTADLVYVGEERGP